MSLVESMRPDWDKRARKNAFYYIVSDRQDWNVSDFLESGERDYQQLVQPVLDRFGFSSEGRTALELGCGAGRMTHSLSTHFGRVIAFDVSPEMLERAREVLPNATNITWVRGNGEDLSEAANEAVDFVFSYLVLQHLPDEKIIISYVRDILRVLKESGLCLFQVNASTQPAMNWKGRVVWGVIDGLWKIGLGGLLARFRDSSDLIPKWLGRLGTELQ